MLWQIVSQNGVLVNLAAASIWLSQVMHSMSTAFQQFVFVMESFDFCALWCDC